MADPDFEEPGEFEAPVDFIQRKAINNYLTSASGEPEEAAQAVRISNNSGIPASVVSTDVEGFQARHISDLSTQIIKGNKVLQDYLADEMSAKVSHKDVGPLDQASESISALASPSKLKQWLEAEHPLYTQSKEAGQAYMRGFGEEPMGRTLAQRPKDMEWALSHPEVYSLVSAPALGMEAMARTIGGLMAVGYEGTSAIFGEPLARDLFGMAEQAMMRGDIGVKGLGGGRTLADRGVHLTELTPDKAGKILETVPEVKPPEPPTETRTAEQQQANLAKHAEVLKDMFHGQQVADVFTRAGEEPPPHVDPLIDKAKEIQIKEDLERLKTAVADANQTETRELSPDHFARFAALHGEGEIGIDAETAQRIYGEKVPEEGDGLLGWIPGIGTRLSDMAVIGGEIWVPRSEFLAKTDRALVNEIGDGLRLRDGGLTVDEAKIDVEPKKVVAEPLTSVRGGAGLEPMAMAGDRKVALELTEPHPDDAAKGLHVINIIDEADNSLGMIEAKFDKANKQLHIENIFAGPKERMFYQPNFLGPTLIRDIGRQLKAMFPEAFGPDGKGITGYRVTGARPEPATTSVKFQPGEDPQAFRNLLAPYWEAVHPDVEVLRAPETPELKAVRDKVVQTLQRIAPQIGRDVVNAIYFPEGGAAQGVYLPDIRKILVSLDAKSTTQTALHEAIHALRDGKFIREDEWLTLEKAARDEGWIEKYEIEKHWKDFDLTDEQKLEEAVAEHFRHWSRAKEITEDPGGVFQRIKEFLEGLKHAFKDVYGEGLSWEEIFKEIDSGRIGRREDVGYTKGDELVRAQPSPKEKALVEKRNKEDYEAELRRALEKKTKTATTEAQSREAQIKKEVEQDLRSTPALAADRLLTAQKFKVDPKFLSEEQRSRLPADYQAKRGVNPDNVAKLLGFDSGDALVERVAMMTEERQRLGMSHREYFNHLRDEEVDRRMTREFGDDPADTLDQARDQALGETQMELMHEETNQAALAVGIDPKITLESMKAMAKRVLGDIPVSEIKSSRYMQKAGALALRAKEAAAKGNLQDVYRLLQQRQLMALLAREARAYERARAGLDKIADRYSKDPTEKTAKRIDTAYYNWIQHALARAGYDVDTRTLEHRVGLEEHQTFNDFVEAKEREMRDLYVPDFVKDPTGLEPIDKMSHAEFEDFNRMVRAMEEQGRDERFLVVQGEQIPIDEAKADMLAQVKDIKALAPKTLDVDRPRKFRSVMKGLWWGHITPETMWNRLDRGDQSGLFHKYLIYPAARAINREVQMMDKYKRKFGEIKRGFEDLDKVVENNLFIDPNTGVAIPMRRRNALRVLADWGNESNRRKLMDGWKIDDPAKVEEFLRKNTTPADWDAMQKVGNLFEEVFNEAEKMSKEVTGVGIPRVEIEPFTDVHGTERRGWYSPVSYERRLPGKSQALMGGDPLERPGNYRATTDQRYSKARTGYVSETALDLDILGQRFGQILHDTAVRPTVIQMNKILMDSSIRRAIRAALGDAPLAEMDSWLRDFANRRNVDSPTERAANDALGFLRANVIGSLIGFNPSTVMKHTPTALMGSIAQVGPFSFAKAAIQMWKTDPVTQMKYLKTVYDESEEIRGRMHNYADLLRGQGQSFEFEQGTFAWLRELNLKVGSFPVAWGDYITTSPTYWAARQKALRQGLPLEEAIDIGNKAVRDAHGTSRLTGQAGIMRTTNELARFYTSLYGFFSHMLQQQYKLAWKARDLLNGQKPEDIEGHWAPHMLGKFMSYYIVPAVIEELVTPYTNEEKDSWGMKIGKGLAFGLSASLTGVRDLVRGLINPNQRGGGILDTMLDLPKEVVKDLSTPRTKDSQAQLIKHTTALMGTVTGLTNAQEGRTAQYIYRYARGMERPKGPWDVATGLRYGKTDKHSRTFEEWWKHTVQGKH